MKEPKHVVTLTPSQHMALLDVLTEHLTRPDSTLTYVDIVRAKETTVGELVRVVTKAKVVR